MIFVKFVCGYNEGCGGFAFQLTGPEGAATESRDNSMRKWTLTPFFLPCFPFGGCMLIDVVAPFGSPEGGLKAKVLSDRPLMTLHREGSVAASGEVLA